MLTLALVLACASGSDSSSLGDSDTDTDSDTDADTDSGIESGGFENGTGEGETLAGAASLTYQIARGQWAADAKMVAAYCRLVPATGQYESLNDCWGWFMADSAPGQLRECDVYRCTDYGVQDWAPDGVVLTDWLVDSPEGFDLAGIVDPDRGSTSAVVLTAAAARAGTGLVFEVYDFSDIPGDLGDGHALMSIISYAGSSGELDRAVLLDAETGNVLQALDW